MSAYYNEHDPFAASWLRELIKAGHIASGIVDERSIEDVKPDELRTFSQCHFFAGIGVWSYALRQAGWPDDRPVWTGSCPCQPFSTAGKRAGTSDERHLWPALFHLIQELQPGVFFGEQVASKGGFTWFDTVQSDLEGAVYACGVSDLCAAGFGAPHRRQRLYFVADSTRQCLNRSGTTGQRGRGKSSDRSQPGGGNSRVWGVYRMVNGFWKDAWWPNFTDGKQRPVEPGTFPLAHGATNRVGRLRGYGNALVAPVATAFIEAFLETEGDK